MTYTITELKEKVYEEVYKVYQTFKDYFGEDKVDLQGLIVPNRLPLPSGVTQANLHEKDISDTEIDNIRRRIDESNSYSFILVYWPQVVVSNENNRSTLIRDLFAKITLTTAGYIPYEYTFGLNRSTYTTKEFFGCGGRGYLHSHIPGIPKGDYTRFQNPCLGTGPIRQTINTLKSSNDEISWMLFCRELDLYVTVESLRGGPYMRLEDISSSRPLYEFDSEYCGMDQSTFAGWKRSFSDTTHSSTFLRNFVEYYLSNGHLTLSFVEGRYVPGMPFFDYVVDISNCFINFFNQTYTDQRMIQRLFDSKIIMTATTSQRRFYECRDNTFIGNLDNHRGKYVCTFKGQEVRLRIEESREAETTAPCVVLRADLARHILYRILRVINYNCINEHLETARDGGGQTSATNQKVGYV